MTYDSFVTAAIVREAQALVGAFVDHISQPGERELCITFYAGRGKSRWVFSADARLARVHAIAAKPENLPIPPNFCMVARKWIDGARLAAVKQVGFDRVLRWEFTRSDGNRTLIAEVMGKHSNLILLDAEQIVLGAIKRVPASVSRTRQVLPGLPYTAPPGDRLNPLTADREAFKAGVRGQGSGVRESGAAREESALADPPLTPPDLVRTLAGFGPFAAAEVIARAGAGDPDAVWDRVSELASATREGRFEPTLFFRAVKPPSPGDDQSPHRAPNTEHQTPNTEHRPPLGFWAFPSVQVSPDAQEPAVTMSAAADRYFTSFQLSSGEDTLRKELLTAVRKERERLERLTRRLEEDLRRGEDVDRWKVAGELLAANMWQVERGQGEVEVANYYDPEQRPLKIELDPELTPQENVERLFRRYRKGTDAALQAMEQSEKISARLAAVRDREARVRNAILEALPGLREELAHEGLLKKPEPGRTPSEARRQAPEYPPGVRIRRYTVEGWEVLLGENATSNDYLTTRVARPDDWWLHVRASTSAHVVIRTAGHPERVPPAVLREAARITAAHSESKHSSYVPVDYVLRKFVRKPRGSAPGLVTLRGEKTLYVEPTSDSAAR
jgi:predicted ribosome quality control (RQC) complex YloA/Tae2 family protein